MNWVIVFAAKYFVFLSIRIVAALWLGAKMDVKINLGWQLVVSGGAGRGLVGDLRPSLRRHPTVRDPAHRLVDKPRGRQGLPIGSRTLAPFLAFTMLAYSRRIGSVLLLIAVLVGSTTGAEPTLDVVDALRARPSPDPGPGPQSRVAAAARANPVDRETCHDRRIRK